MMTAYWRRATAAGVLTSMLVGSGVHLGFYILGFFSPDPGIGQMTKFRAYFLFGCEPIIWSICASTIAGVIVSLFTSPPREELVERLFSTASQP